MLLLVRHAAIDWSGRRFCGRTDPPLSGDGMTSARVLARELAASAEPGLRVVSSPLRRARQTAKAILEAIPGSTLEIDNRWSETDFGIAEGLTYDELQRVAPDIAKRLVDGAFDVDWPGGEGATALAARVGAAFHDVVMCATPTVVVSHGGPLTIAIAIATGQDPSQVVAPEPGVSGGCRRIHVSLGAGSRNRTHRANQGPGATIHRVKRRRSSAPGGLRPDGRWILSILLGTLLLTLAACGSSTSTEEAGKTARASPAASSPAETPSTEPTVEPPAESPAGSTTPEPSTPEPPATAAPTATADTGTGRSAACSGSDENRDFFASMAAAVDWTVYCPVLADSWFVDDGRYRLAGGGWLEISYDGPGDTRLILQQGAFCAAGDGCVPSGREVGPTPFGDRTGTLIAGDDGTWSVLVDRGANPSWLLVVNGLDEAAVRKIAADLRPVAG